MQSIYDIFYNLLHIAKSIIAKRLKLGIWLQCLSKLEQDFVYLVYLFIYLFITTTESVGLTKHYAFSAI